jgi:release factor glutamine methyltransferase
MTLQQALAEASAHISRRDAEVLLTHILQRDRAWLFLHTGDELAAADAAAFRELVARRAAHEPMQHLTGVQEFFGLPLRVTRDTLIPRPETEHLVEAVLAWAATQPAVQTPGLRLLDVGTGSGAIALTLAKHLPQAEIVACDLSPAALEVAGSNARELGLEQRVRFVLSDLLEAFDAELQQGRRFNAVVSNPPYVSTGDAAEMQPEVRDFEPHSALFAGDDGLGVYRRLIPQAHAALTPGGLLAMEIGFGQREALAELLSGWKDVRFLDDYAGIPRVVLATRD